MIYSLTDLQAIFTSSTQLEARALLARKQVATPNIRRNGQRLTAVIHSSEERPIRIYIQVEESIMGGLPSIQGECSHCGKVSCHHIAATLLMALSDDVEPDQPPPPTKSPIASDYPAHIQQRLLYLLSPVTDSIDGIEITTATAKLIKTGKFSQLRDYEPSWASSSPTPRYLLKSDLQLLAELEQLILKPNQKRRRLHSTQGTQMLQRILESGRCFLGQLDQPLKQGRVRHATLQWQLDNYGNQHAQLKTEPAASSVFLLSLPHYLDQQTGECGRLTTNIPPSLIEEVLHQPTMNPLQVEEYWRSVTARYPTLNISAPHQLILEQWPTCQVTPQLLITTEGNKAANDPLRERVQLTFDYNGLTLSRNEPPQLRQGNRVIQILRQQAFEAAAVEQLLATGLSSLPNNPLGDLFALKSSAEAWFKFQQHQLPLLKEQGWQITIDRPFRYPLATVQEWLYTLEPMEQNPHYRFSFGIRVDDQAINLLPELVPLLRTINWNQLHQLSPKHCFYLPIGNGVRAAIPMAKIKPMLDNLFELFQADALDQEGYLPLTKIQLTRLHNLSSNNKQRESLWCDRSEVRLLAEQLRQITQPAEVAPPVGLQATLRDYQLHGLAWLQFLRDNDLAGILADEMGLGKTVQALAHILLEKEQGRLTHPCLIIAPTSLMANWRQEARRFTPDLKVLVLHGQERQKRFADIPYNDLILTTYPLLLRDYETLCRQHYHLLILDEAQLIKNHQARASQLVREIPARYRLCLTGTPLENHLGELWSLFDFLLPGLLGSEHQFKKRVRKPIEQSTDDAARQRLAGWLRPFMLRRTKQAVATELPAKTEIIRSVELCTEQRALYEHIQRNMSNKIRTAIAEKGLGQCRILILNALLRMRQVCCDPRLLPIEEAAGATQSAKLEMLMSMLPEMVDEGRQILLFSQFTSMLDLIETEVKKAGIKYAKLTGQTRNRTRQIEKFQSGEAPLFLISLKAGGVGLNLTRADSVIHYDPWWNPAVEHQATDRAHRIGQTKPLFVYKLITTGSVEEQIQALQKRKQLLADSLFEHGGNPLEWWSESDLEALFEPLK